VICGPAPPTRYWWRWRSRRHVSPPSVKVPRCWHRRHGSSVRGHDDIGQACRFQRTQRCRPIIGGTSGDGVPGNDAVDDLERAVAQDAATVGVPAKLVTELLAIVLSAIASVPVPELKMRRLERPRRCRRSCCLRQSECQSFNGAAIVVAAFRNGQPSSNTEIPGISNTLKLLSVRRVDGDGAGTRSRR